MALKGDEIMPVAMNLLMLGAYLKGNHAPATAVKAEFDAMVNRIKQHPDTAYPVGLIEAVWTDIKD